MRDDDRDPETLYERLIHFCAESVFDASDEEIREEMRAAGEDPDEAAERLRHRLLDVVRQFREQRNRPGTLALLRVAHLVGLGAALRELRQAERLSQRDVARRTGLAASQLSRWERGHERPSLASLVKYLGAVRADLSDLQRQLLVAAGEAVAAPRPAREREGEP